MKGKLKSFFGSVGYLVMFFAIQLIVSMIGGIIIGIIYTFNNVDKMTSGGLDIENLTNQIAGVASYMLLVASIITILVFLLIYKIRKKRITQELDIVKTKNINLIIAICLGICAWLFNTGVLSLIEEAGLLTKYFESMNESMAPLMQGNIIISILAVGIIAPFEEELLFRGVIYKTLNKNISTRWAIIIQAILFGVAHGNFIQGSYATLLGIIFGYVTYKTKSLWPAIIMHVVNNSIATILPMFLAETIMGTGIYIGFAMVGVIGVAISLFFIIRKNNNIKNDLVNIIHFNNQN